MPQPMNVCKLGIVWGAGLNVQDKYTFSGGYRLLVVERSICVSKPVHGANITVLRVTVDRLA